MEEQNHTLKHIVISLDALVCVCTFIEVQGQLTYVYFTSSKRMCVADGLLSLWMCEIDSNLIFVCVCVCVGRGLLLNMESR